MWHDEDEDITEKEKEREREREMQRSDDHSHESKKCKVHREKEEEKLVHSDCVTVFTPGHPSIRLSRVRRDPDVERKKRLRRNTS